jgi:drug/metabolite transporter (DMT)-like permease
MRERHTSRPPSPLRLQRQERKTRPVYRISTVSQPRSTSENPPTQLTMGPAEYGLIALQSMTWGSAFFFIALAGRELPPITMTAMRLVPAVMILLCVVSWLGLRLPATRRDWGYLFLIATFNNVLPFILIIYAQREVTGGIAAVFNATAPLFSVFIAAVFMRDERLAWRRVGGIAVGILGVAVLISATTGIDAGRTGSATAKLMLLTAACSYAAANVMTRRTLSGLHPFVLACAHMIAALVLASVAAMVVEQPWTLEQPGSTALLAVLGMGVFGSALSSLCHFTVLKRAGATNAMLVTIILPLTPILLGSAFLGDRMSARELAGAFIIACALVIIDGRLIARVTNIFRSRPVP